MSGLQGPVVLEKRTERLIGGLTPATWQRIYRAIGQRGAAIFTAFLSHARNELIQFKILSLIRRVVNRRKIIPWKIIPFTKLQSLFYYQFQSIALLLIFFLDKHT